MSGILGVWNTDGRPVGKDLLGRLSAVLAHRGPDGEGSWLQGPIGMACQISRVTPEAATESQPAVHPSGTVLVFDGRLDNREELLAELQDEPGLSRQAPDALLVLAAYHAFGEAFAQHLNGDFALGLFDPARRRLLLARDAIGVRPLYYCRVGTTVAFASEIKALLAHPAVAAKPNDEVMAWFLLRQEAVDTEGATFFAGILRVQPGFLAIATPQGCDARPYWDFDVRRQLRFSSFDEYAEAFRSYFEQAVRRRLRSAHPVAISVSGGVDSSSVFCVAQGLRRRHPSGLPPVVGISYLGAEGSPADEKRYLQEVEKACGVNIQCFPMPLGFQESARHSVWHIEFPLMDEMANCSRQLYTRIRDAGARVVLTGLWGDQVLFDQAYLVTLFRRFAWGQVHRHLRTYAEWFPGAGTAYFRRIFTRQLLRAYLPEPVAGLARKYRARHRRNRRVAPVYSQAFQQHARWRAFRPLRDREFASEHARSLYYTAKSGYHLLGLEWDNKVAASQGLEAAFPFLDRDLVSFLMAIPGEVACPGGVPKGLLREAMRGVLPATVRERHDKADGTDLANQAMEDSSSELIAWLETGSQAVRRGYVNRDAGGDLRGLRGQIRGPDCELTFGLSDLYGLELWLQTFFGKEGVATRHEQPTIH